MERDERRPEQAAPPDAAGHRGSDTRPEELLEDHASEEQSTPLAEDAAPQSPAPRRKLPPAFPLGSTVLLVLLLAAVVILTAYLFGIFAG